MKFYRKTFIIIMIMVLSTVPVFADLAPVPRMDTANVLAIATVAVIVIAAIIAIRVIIRKKRGK